ncbi:hypothetical protein BGZ63DRAFT_364374 [Mariannaea sp. PMI_226]|nr:hypothetical protein BGZ63DRAFT_364374 [Mariannaea sp. PMI_226]
MSSSSSSIDSSSDALPTSSSPTRTLPPLLQDSSLVSWFPDSTIAGDGADLSPLDRLLRAIQFRDVPRILPYFVEWVKILGESKPFDSVFDELGELPVETFSEILRWVDPIANPSQDIAYDLNITRGQTQHNETAKLVDRFGVRVSNRLLLESAQILLSARRRTGRKLLIQDYEIFIRIAGAASDSNAVLYFFGASASDGMAESRTTATWTEFTKAHFLLDPAYYQFDRSRVAVLARQLYNRHSTPTPRFNRLERMRHSMGALLREPFNRNRRRVAQDLRMSIRNKRRIRIHWDRAKAYGLLVNEEYKCASMMAFARGSSVIPIRGNILWRGFRLRYKEDRKTGQINVWGGKYFRPGNPREPTERFLYAIVETFGSMSRIRAGLKLLVWSSYKWDIPIPHKAWSNMLQWAYVSASKPFRTMRRLHSGEPGFMVSSKDILEVWNIMTQEPFNIQPTFEDYNVFIKALIFHRSYGTAIDVIRNEAVPYYRRLEEEYRNLVEDEILREVTEHTYQRKQIELKKEYVRWSIRNWFVALLDGASSSKMAREKTFMSVQIPDLIAEFGEFFPRAVQYRTAQGRMIITRPEFEENSYVFLQRSLTLPQPLGGKAVESKVAAGQPGPHDPGFEWPQARQLNVQRFVRKPLARPRTSGLAPSLNDASGHEWWATLYQEMKY